MIQTICWSGLFFILGFGAGRLRSHTLLSRLFQNRQRMREHRIHDASKEDVLTIWSVMYTQSIESVRELQKSYLTASTVGLAVVISVLVKDGEKSYWVTISAFFFLISIICSFTPLSGLAVKTSKDLNSHLRKENIKKDEIQPITLPKPLKAHRYHWTLNITLFFFALAVVSFALSIALLPSDASHSFIKIPPWPKYF